MTPLPKTTHFLYCVYLVYFLCGLAQCFEGIFLPEFKEHFALTYTQQMYTMFAKNVPFALFSLFVGFFLGRIGYKNCLTLALFLFAAGTWLIVPGLEGHNYALVLVAFFIIGTGFTVELVAGNPLLSMLGPPANSASRLNVGNALGAVAQIAAPLLVTFLIPRTVTDVAGKLPYIRWIFIGTAAALAALGVYTLLFRDTARPAATTGRQPGFDPGGSIWSNPRVVLGFAAIFLVIGVEAGLFGFYRNYLEDPRILGLDSFGSQRMFTVYFALFAAGRLTGSYLQKKFAATTTLTVSLLASLGLVVAMMSAQGWPAAIAFTLLGFFASIFFPTLYAIAIEGLGPRTGQASGLLTMGFLGGALLPVLQGKVADLTTLQFSFAVAVVPYLFALFFVRKGHTLTTWNAPGEIADGR